MLNGFSLWVFHFLDLYQPLGSIFCTHLALIGDPTTPSLASRGSRLQPSCMSSLSLYQVHSRMQQLALTHAALSAPETNAGPRACFIACSIAFTLQCLRIAHASRWGVRGLKQMPVVEGIVIIL